MTPFVIPTPRLDLVLQTPEETLAWVESLPPADRAEVSEEWIAQVRATAAGDPWSLSFRVVERESGITVGGCGFKGPPNHEQVVELAYGIDEPYRERGFAAEAAAALTKFALAHNRVQIVRAHTRTDNGPSTRVLARCGFHRVGPFHDPEDGLVDRWEFTLG